MGAIPTSAQNLIATVPIGCLPEDADVNMVTNKVYVVSTGGDSFCTPGTNHPSFTVIDGATNSATTLPLGFIPSVVVVNPITNKIYVTPGFFSPPCTENSIVVIDGATNSTTTVPVACVANSGGNISVNPNTNKIYVITTGGGGPSDSVVVIDGATNSTTSIPVPIRAGFVAVNPNTNKIYVLSHGSKLLSPAMVTVIDGATKLHRHNRFGGASSRIHCQPQHQQNLRGSLQQHELRQSEQQHLCD